MPAAPRVLMAAVLHVGGVIRVAGAQQLDVYKRQSPPLFGGIRRVACTLLRKDAWLCHRQLFPGLFFCFFAFFDSLTPRLRRGGTVSGLSLIHICGP